MLRFGSLEIDRDERVVRLGGEARPLTGHQFDLLWALAESAGRVLSRAQLMERVRGEDPTLDPRRALRIRGDQEDPHNPSGS
nr:winged helix-turn-helix domain-containing protein [Nannocystis sp.]